MREPFLIQPTTYTAFENETDMIEQCKQWGLLSEKAVRAKTFYYKGSGMNTPCTIIGIADPITAVITLEDGREHCIHPSYLKEMQASAYGQKQTSFQAAAEDQIDNDAPASPAAEVPAVAPKPAANDAPSATAIIAPSAAAAPEPKPAAAPKKARIPKLQLPEGKVKMTATVKEFTTVPNHFADQDDEVVVYEAVSILEPEPLEVGDAWSSFSATLKKLELQEGDVLVFDCKIVAKKLTRHPVPYKINNPAKIQKQEQN
ncbi:hypothetical protein [Paenibacillus sp. GCM10027626]|uniref:hypothetical protein n=1 Tax=Paenibacillus sp. GCM10027626 TaxID=3273411 RepID=UPI0036345F76